MKNFLVENNERELILKMHKSKVFEQTTTPAQKTNDKELDILKKAIAAGCLKNGSLKVRKSTGRIFYRKSSVKDPSKEIDIFGDYTYEFTDGSKKGKWSCKTMNTTPAPVQPSAPTDCELKIETLKKQGWNTLDKLQGVDLNNLDKTHDTFVLDGCTPNKLYRLKVASSTFTPGTNVPQLNDDQKQIVEKFEGMGFKLNPTELEKRTLIPLTADDLGVDQSIFPNGLTMWIDPKTWEKLKKGGSVQADLEASTPERKVCRDRILTFYQAFQRRKSSKIDQASLSIMKPQIQACKDQFYNKWGISFGKKSGKNLDNILDTLSGGEGGPSRYGPDNVFRLD